MDRVSRLPPVGWREADRILEHGKRIGRVVPLLVSGVTGSVLPNCRPGITTPVTHSSPQMAEGPSANTAMILGIVSTAGAFVSCFLGFMGIIALMYARKASRERASSGGLLRERDKAVLGRVFGIIGIVIASLGSVLYAIYVFALMASISSANA